MIRIIFGPPGTGKTSRLLSILEEEMEQVEAERIAYVSFTREGAYAARDRAVERFGIGPERFRYFRTLHSLAFRELGMNRNQIIDKEGYREFSQAMGMHFTGYYTEEFSHNDDRYLFFNILYRNNAKTAINYLKDLDIQRLRFVSSNYRRFKRHHGTYDFTDIIQEFIREMKKVDVEVAIIDEAQDLTTLQWQMVWVAFSNAKRIYIAGDDDQAIYEWSGADVDYFLQIEGDIEILHHSYRLPNNIVEFATQITDRIKPRVDKKYNGRGAKGILTKIMSIDEVTIDNDETWMFLARNHTFLKPVVESLRNQGLVYSLNGRLSFSERRINAILKFESARREGSMDETTESDLHTMLIEGWTLQRPWYDNFVWEEGEVGYYRDLMRTKNYKKPCKIRVSTIHSVKGGEADNVVVSLNVTRQVYMNLHDNPNSEYRVLYVGCTRARKNLYILEQDAPYGFDIGERL